MTEHVMQQPQIGCDPCMQGIEELEETIKRLETESGCVLMVVIPGTNL